jgi:hypothetical protein
MKGAEKEHIFREAVGSQDIEESLALNGWSFDQIFFEIRHLKFVDFSRFCRFFLLGALWDGSTATPRH